MPETCRHLFFIEYSVHIFHLYFIEYSVVQSKCVCVYVCMCVHMHCLNKNVYGVFIELADSVKGNYLSLLVMANTKPLVMNSVTILKHIFEDN